jgi:hypothetical protein
MLDYDSAMFELYEVESELHFRLLSILGDIPNEYWEQSWDRLWCSFHTIKSNVDEYLQEVEEVTGEDDR